MHCIWIKQLSFESCALDLGMENRKKIVKNALQDIECVSLLEGRFR